MSELNHKRFLLDHIAELIVVRASAYRDDAQRDYPQWELDNSNLKRLLAKGVGGVILYGGSTTDLEQRCFALRRWAKKPILLCADVEEGLGQRFKGGTVLIPPMAIGRLYNSDSQKAIYFAERYGSCIGKQAKKCGLNWVLAPVCDINTNPNNPVINVRSWGEDPFTVAELSSSFHKGIVSEGVMTCAKHFPGHGNTSVDSHLELPVLSSYIEELKQCELIPFSYLINKAVPSIMTAHLMFENIDSENPVTFSPVLTENLLRKKFFYDGLIVTDALIMDAIAKLHSSGEAAVRAVLAGADLILMPGDVDEAIQALYEAFASGRIPFYRLEESLRRRRLAIDRFEIKSKVLSQGSSYSSNYIIEETDDCDFAGELIDCTLESINCKYLEFDDDSINLILVDNFATSQSFNRRLPIFSFPESLGLKSILWNEFVVNPLQEKDGNVYLLPELCNKDILLQLFMRGNPFQGKNDIASGWISLIKTLQKQKRLKALVVYGSPYLWQEICEVLDSSISAVYSPGQMEEAQKRVFINLIDSKKTKNYGSNEFTN